MSVRSRISRIFFPRIVREKWVLSREASVLFGKALSSIRKDGRGARDEKQSWEEEKNGTGRYGRAKIKIKVIVVAAVKSLAVSVVPKLSQDKQALLDLYGALHFEFKVPPIHFAFEFMARF